LPHPLRILVFHTRPESNPLAHCGEHVELVYVDNVPRALALLQREHFDGIYAATDDLTLIQQAGTLLQADRVLQSLPDGVAVVDSSVHVVWANKRFQEWCGGPVEGKHFYEALGSPEMLGPEFSPFFAAGSGASLSTCVHLANDRYLELLMTPMRSAQGEITHYLCAGRDITSERLKQRKLDAIHQAGRQLADLDAEHLAQMSVPERIDLLKSRILRYSRDLLHYDVVDIRLLDPSTGRLEPLITEGLPPEAAQRVLYARPEGNGVTGFVASTGKSYLCPDTTVDALYIPGLPGARSSLTVPLIYQDKVIGTFNVESPTPNAFTEEDVQFLEIFSREIAHALHTLELLTAEKLSTATQSIEAIRREVALPVDEILVHSAAVLDRYIGIERDIETHLRAILENARQIKQSIEKVGETLAGSPMLRGQEGQSRDRLRGMRVLVVDQDERVRRSAHSILGRLGCLVETVGSAQAACAMARQSVYDAIVTDIRLPDATGYELFCQLRSIQPDATLVLMSGFGYDPNHSIVKARQEGLGYVLYKPFRVEQLLEVLERIRAEAEARQPAAAGTTS